MMSQQAKNFLHHNGAKLQAVTFSSLLGLLLFIVILVVLGWPARVTQAQQERALNKAMAALERRQKAVSLRSAFLLQDPSFDFMEIVWTGYSISDGSGQFNSVGAITADENGHLWFGGYHSGSPPHGMIQRRDPDGSWHPIFSEADTNIEDLKVDDSDYLWVATNAGAYRGVATSTSPIWQSYTVGNNDIRTIAVDGDHIWFGTYGSGAYRFTPDTSAWVTYTTGTSPGLCSNDIHDIAVAGNGDVWFGTDDNGLCKVDDSSQWTSYLTGTQVSDIDLDAEGNVWVAAPNSGVISINPAGISTTHSITINQPSTVVVDSTERKWVGSLGDGLAILSSDNSEVQYHDTTIPDSLVDDTVYTIVEVADGAVWVGHETNGYPEGFVTSQGVTRIHDLIAEADSPVAVGMPTTLTATVSHGSGVTYTWDFKDGAPAATGAVVSHTYQAAGDYPVVVTATNSLEQFTATTTVQVIEPVAGLAALNSSPTQLNDATFFTATVTAGNPVSYTWGFGDGSLPTTGAHADHTYTDIGHYTAVVTATTAFNAITATTPVTITDVPIAGLAAGNDGPTVVDYPTTFVASVAAGTNVDYIWAFGDGAMGAGMQVTHTYTAGGDYTAVVTASNSVGTMTASTPVEVLAHPDLTLAKSGLSLIPAGSPLDYEINVANRGVEAASNVTVTDTLPVDTLFISQESPYAYTYDPQAHTVVWTIPLLPEESTETILLQTQVVTDAQVGTQLVNTVSSTLSEEDVTLQNNQATYTTTVVAPPAGPDLALTKSGPAQVIAGTTMDYAVTVVNIGDLPAFGVVITDSLPGAVTFIDSSHPSYNTTYASASHSVVWAVGTLAAGASYHISLQVQVPITMPTGAMTNTVTVAADADVNIGNDWAVFQTEVLAAAPRLAITPSSDGTAGGAAYLPVQQGFMGTQVVTVTNTGTDVLLGGIAVMDAPATAAVNYPWLTVEPLSTTADLAPGAAVAFTVTAAITSGMPAGAYYDVIGFDAPQDPRVSAQPFYLGVYAHPPLVSFTAPVTNSLDEAVAGAQVTLEKQSPSVWVVDGVARPDTYFAQTRPTDATGSAAFSAVEEGVYTFTVSASGHLSQTGVVTIPDDLQNGQLPLPALTALPGLVFEPAQNVNLSVTAGEFAYFTYRIRNEGPAPAENFSVETPADLPWVSSGVPAGVTQLARGEAMSVTLFLDTPPVTTAETHEAVITVTADFVDPAHLQAQVNVLVTTTGNLDVTVTDLAGIPVSGASVYVTNQSGRAVNGPGGQQIVYDTDSGTTNANGQVLFSGLPAGEYNFTVDADGYYVETGSASVVPDDGSPHEGINEISVSLTADPFTYAWTVEETVIADVYSVTVQISYQADVLEPTLFVSPAQFCAGDEIEFIIANTGPVMMTNIALSPHHSGVSFSPVATTTLSIGSLAPGEAYIGRLATSAAGGDAAPVGAFHVSAEYSEGGSAYAYTTRSRTTNQCAPDGGSWGWSWSSGTASGSYTGSRPTFPGGNGGPPAPSASGQEAARLTLSGEATLERQAFNARLALDSLSASAVEDISVTIEVRDENGLVSEGFAVLPDVPTALADLAPGGSTSQSWLIIPDDLGITEAAGAVYDVRAQIRYRWNGQVYTTSTIPRPITVLPQPHVRLYFAHTQPDASGDFTVAVMARNDGYGTARNLALDLSQLTAVTDLDGNGRSLLFELQETAVNGNPAPRTYAFHFGDLAPEATITGTLRIGVSASDGAPLTNQIVTGFDVSCEHLPYQGVELSPLLTCENLGQIYLTHECPVCDLSQTSEMVGGPINTANGNYTYRQQAPRLSTVGPALQFSWIYNSLQSGIAPGYAAFSSTLSAGWTHNYQASLDLSGVNGPQRLAVMRAAHGTPLYFYAVRDGFAPAPGLRATMTGGQAGGNTVYTVTAANQSSYVFDEAGQLMRQFDAQGNVLEFSYDISGLLSQVQEPVSQRFLSFSYDEAGRVSTVGDSGGRTTAFGYNALGHLAVVTDTRGLPWRYDYSLVNGHYLLLRITDPDGRVIEETGFNSLGQAITQTYRGESLTIAYHDDGRRVTVDGAGMETTSIYNLQNLLVASADAASALERYELDFYQNRITQEDRNGNATRFEKTAFGYPTVITDALGLGTHLTYDARNNPRAITNALGAPTQFVYNAQNQPETVTNALDDSSTYTYNDLGQRTSSTDENGHTTVYGYDSLGQLQVITDALGATTTYGYDAFGRLVTTTDSLINVTVNQYDAMDHLVQATANYRPGLPQNHLHEYNLITRYAYDGAGRTISTTNTLGQTDLTFYDSAGRVVATVANWDGSPYTTHDDLCNFVNPDPEYNVCNLTAYDSAGRVQATTNALGRVTRTFYDERSRVVATVQNWSGTISDPAQCAFPPAQADVDLCTLYAYDEVGNTTVVTDPLGRQTRTFYDPLNRVAGTIQNWSGTITQTAELQTCLSLPAERDTDLCTLNQYDEVGNTIIVTDTLGRMTRTFYDELNRVEGAIQNWQAGFTLADCFDAGLNPLRDENVCTLYEYDDAGNRTVTTNAKQQRSLTVYDSANRPVVQVQNWDGTTVIEADGTGCADTAANHNADENLCSVTAYDALGRRASVTDVLGKVTEFSYDGLGRVVTTTRYLDGAPVQMVTGYDALGNRLSETDAEGHTTNYTYDGLNRLATTTSPEGVVVTQTYNAGGWLLSTIDVLDHTTTNTYDDLGRLLTTTDPENNTTQYEYDAAGNQVAMIDAEGVRTMYGYDGLDRLSSVTENDTGGAQTNDSNLLTQYSYDALGNRTLITNARGYTVTLTVYDELNRPVDMQDALGNTTQYTYDLLGNRAVVTDANGEVTEHSYDALNRVITTTYMADGVTVGYQYDAAGNRTEMVDDVGVTSYVYDDFYRLITVTNPFNAVVGYRYDDAGNRTQLIYPDGREVGYTYDGDNRLVVVDDWNSDLTTYQYDGAGRLITTTLPNGVTSVNGYDDANRLLSLRHEGADSSLLAEYVYELDGVGNRVAVTETLRAPDVVQTIEAYVEQNGLLVLEAENGAATAAGNHDWETQTAQAGYEGTGYRRALPDIGAQYDEAEVESSPHLSWSIYNETTDTYSVWVRGMAPDAGGDSLHVGLDGATPSTGADLTGFTDTWGWSRVTMDGGDATLDLATPGEHTLEARMREDGLRVDRLLLVTDTDYIPTGLGPVESLSQTITATIPGELGATSIAYSYDALHRLMAVAYSGAITATFEYVYDAAGNRTLYTKTITSTEVTTYTYNAANQLVTAESNVSMDIWHYEYDGNGNLLRQVPNGLTPTAGEIRYSFDQRNQLTRIDHHDGSDYQVHAEATYNGIGHRLRTVVYVAGMPLTTTYTLDSQGGAVPLVIEGSASSTYLLYGLFGLGEYDGAAWQYYLGDAQFSVRQLVDGVGGIAFSRTYGPFGDVLHQAGDGSSVFGFAASQGGSGGLLYIDGRYFDPNTGRFLSPESDNFDPRRPGTLNGYVLAFFLANPGGLFFGPLIVWSWRKRKGGRGSSTSLLILGLLLTIGMVSCQEDEDSTSTLPSPIPPPPMPSITPPSPTGTPTSTSAPPPSPTPPGTATQIPIPECPTPLMTSPATNVIMIRPNYYTEAGTRMGVIPVDFTASEFAGFITPNAPTSIVIDYHAPIISFEGVDIITSSQYGGRYYDPTVWDPLHPLDLMARIVGQERAYQIDAELLGRRNVAEGLAIASVIRNRLEAPAGFAGDGLRGKLLAENQFAFTLADIRGGDSVAGAQSWADVGVEGSEKRQRYEHSLTFAVGVMGGTADASGSRWFTDTSAGATFFCGNGVRAFSSFYDTVCGGSPARTPIVP